MAVVSRTQGFWEMDPEPLWGCPVGVLISTDRYDHAAIHRTSRALEMGVLTERSCIAVANRSLEHEGMGRLFWHCAGDWRRKLSGIREGMHGTVCSPVIASLISGHTVD